MTLTGDVQSLVANTVFNCVLTIIEDASGGAQANVPILLLQSHFTQAVNKELWFKVPFSLIDGSL